MGVIHHPSAPDAPQAAVSRILSRFHREQLHGFIAVAIDLLDAIDGDPDLENATDLEDDFALSKAAAATLNGPGCPISDAGGQNDEDDFNTALHRGHHDRGPGCPISDPDIAVDDGPCDVIGGGEDCEPDYRDQPIPAYGVDQSRGPINEIAADLDRRAHVLGLVRSPTGGWRRA